MIDFFRIKRQTHTHSEKSHLTILKVKKLKACMCLSNIYTTHTQHVHKLSRSLCIWCVRLVYMFTKHVHAHKLSDQQLVTLSFLPPCMCLSFNSKKNSLVISTLQFRGINFVGLSCPRYAFVHPSLCLRYRFASLRL